MSVASVAVHPKGATGYPFHTLQCGKPSGILQKEEMHTEYAFMTT